MVHRILALTAVLTIFALGTGALALNEIPGSLGDRVWWDQNRDGVQDPGEPGIDGAQVALLAPDGTTTTQVTRTVVVDGKEVDGYYLFENLGPGAHVVTVTSLPAAPNGGMWTQTFDLDDGKVPASFATPNESPRALDLTAGVYLPEYDPYGDGVTVDVVDSARDVDFGYVTIALQGGFGGLGDRVWWDKDSDGVQDEGEPGIDGAKVQLVYDANHTGIFGDSAVYNGMGVTDPTFTETTRTEAGVEGYYFFAGLSAGSYQVTVTSLPAPASGSWKQTFDKDDGKATTFATPNQMPSQLLKGEYKVNADGLLVWTVDTVTDVDFGYNVVAPPPTGPFFTFTQGGWGSKPSGNNPGMLLQNNWAKVFGGSLVVGAVKTITLTSAKAVEVFLPQGGTAGKLTKSYMDPKSKTEAGVLAGQVTALKLSVAFSNAGVLTKGLGDLKAVSGPLAGKSVRDILATCEAALGGASTGYSLADLNAVATAINENYDNGTTDNGYLAP